MQIDSESSDVCWLFSQFAHPSWGNKLTNQHFASLTSYRSKIIHIIGQQQQNCHKIITSCILLCYGNWLRPFNTILWLAYVFSLICWAWQFSYYQIAQRKQAALSHTGRNTMNIIHNLFFVVLYCIVLCCVVLYCFVWSTDDHTIAQRTVRLWMYFVWCDT